MILIVGLKKQLWRMAVSGLAILLILGWLVMTVLHFVTEPAPVFNGYLTEERIPSGNPLRVDSASGSAFDRSVEQFVLKLQDFYYEERE